MQAINEVTSTVPHDYSAAAPTDTMHSDLKTAINNLIWMYAPETITLGEADNISNDILCMILRGNRKP